MTAYLATICWMAAATLQQEVHTLSKHGVKVTFVEKTLRHVDLVRLYGGERNLTMAMKGGENAIYESVPKTQLVEIIVQREGAIVKLTKFDVRGCFNCRILSRGNPNVAISVDPKTDKVGISLLGGDAAGSYLVRWLVRKSGVVASDYRSPIDRRVFIQLEANRALALRRLR
jgi:hypothetical protein